MNKTKFYRVSPKKLLKMIDEFNKEPGFKEAIKMAFKYHTRQV